MKNNIRKNYINLINELDYIDVKRMSSKVIYNLIKILKNIEFDVVCSYMPKNNEIDIKPFNEEVLEYKKLYVPKIVSKGRMNFIEITKSSTYMVNKFNIQESINNNPIYSDDDKAIFIVPLIAFNRDKYRIGYGGGYYDRFFEKRRNNTSECNSILIGVAYSFQETIHSFQDKYDIRLDYIVTDKEIIN